jgi:hypothetical protein
MSVTRGRVVRTPANKKPYKVVLEHAHSEDTEHPVASVREGENMIKQQSPPAPKRDKSRDSTIDDLPVED